MNKLLGKWLISYVDLAEGREATCPHCGGKNLVCKYLRSKVNSNYGWGAVWCEDCRNAFALSRVILRGVSQSEITPRFARRFKIYLGGTMSYEIFNEDCLEGMKLRAIERAENIGVVI